MVVKVAVTVMMVICGDHRKSGDNAHGNNSCGGDGDSGGGGGGG